METFLGLGALILISGFIVFAFRQGLRVKKPPQNVPGEDATTLITTRHLESVDRP